MASYKELFMRHMDREGVKYEDRNDFVVKVTYGGDNLKSIPIFVFFDEDGDPIVQFKCWDIANFKDKEAKGILACNEANTQYRWVKYSIDKDADVVASIDAYIDDDTCGAVCLSLVRRMVNITDDVYPIFARAIWS